MSEAPHAHAPIDVDKLSPMNSSDLLFEHPATPNKIVRFSSEFGFGEEGEAQIAATLEGLKTVQGLYSELESAYSIKTAGFYPSVTQTNRGGAETMIVSNRVEGRGFTSNDMLPDDIKPAAAKLFDNLSAYISSKRTQNQPFLSDIFGIEQYVYDEKQQDFVLVDTDPYYGENAGNDTKYAWSLHELATWAGQVLDPEAIKNWQEKMVENDSSEQLPMIIARIASMN